MSATATEAELIQKITSHEDDIRKIYAEVYPVLKALDQSILFSYEAQKIAALNTLEDPHNIKPEKAIAIVKSIVGSTETDRLHFEYFYGVEMPNGKFLGGFIKDRLYQIGIDHNDFSPYLRVHGWLNEK
jgi:hypothetical protein